MLTPLRAQYHKHAVASPWLHGRVSRPPKRTEQGRKDRRVAPARQPGRWASQRPCVEPATRSFWDHLTAIVTGGLVWPATLNTTGTALPGCTPDGTTAFTW